MDDGKLGIQDVNSSWSGVEEVFWVRKYPVPANQAWAPPPVVDLDSCPRRPWVGSVKLVSLMGLQAGGAEKLGQGYDWH